LNRYTTGADGKRYVFTWNTKKFPNAKGFVKKYSEKGVHIIANIKPCMLLTHPEIENVKTQGLFVKDSGTNLPRIFLIYLQFFNNLYI
jgi:alpha-glucosidase